MMVIETIAKILRPFLEQPVVKRVRRNHGMEHATIHMLNRQRYLLSGRASWGGFMIYGDVPTEAVEKAAHDALQRLRKGQAELAIHPNCGTNLVVTGMLTTFVGALGFTGTNRRRAWERFPVVLMLMMATSLYSLPIGLQVQKYITTSGEPGGLEIVGVKRRTTRMPFRDKPVVVHEVMTRGQ